MYKDIEDWPDKIITQKFTKNISYVNDTHEATSLITMGHLIKWIKSGVNSGVNSGI